MFLHDFDKKSISAITVTPDTCIAETMEIIGAHGVRLALVCQSDGHFWGIVGDGDIRRYLLAGGTLQDPVRAAGNSSPSTLHELPARHDIHSILEARQIEYLPLVENGKVSRFFALLPWRPPGKMHAVIMAGGMGTRLRPVTENCPKPLVEVAGIPILTHSMRRLIAQGVEEFTLCINYLGDMIIDHYGDGTDLGITIQYVREEKRMGTGGALGLVQHELTDPFLVINGDIITDLRISEPVALHKSQGWKATMITREYGYQVPYGVVETGQNGSYLRAREKPKYRYLINTGIYILNPGVLSEIPENTFYDLPTLFDTLHQKSIPTGCYKHEGQWIDIGNISELERANALFRSHKET